MSANNEIQKVVLQYVSKQFDSSCSENDLEKSFDDFKAHQLDKIEIIMRLEDEFNIQISDEELDQVCFVKDIVTLVTSKQ